MQRTFSCIRGFASFFAAFPSLFRPCASDLVTRACPKWRRAPARRGRDPYCGVRMPFSQRAQNKNKNKNGRLKKVDFEPVLDRGFWAILARFVWLLRTLPEKNSPPAGLANHGGQGNPPEIRPHPSRKNPGFSPARDGHLSHQWCFSLAQAESPRDLLPYYSIARSRIVLVLEYAVATVRYAVFTER